MAVYTHFGGMPELIEAIASEGFVRLGRCLERAPTTDDPVTDLVALGLAYRDHAMNNPELYRVMFGVTAPGGHRLATRDLTSEGAPSDRPERRAPFEHLANAVARVVKAGRIRAGDPARIAAQLWSAVHGYVLLEVTGVFGADHAAVEQVFLPLAINLVVGAGDDFAAATRSAAKATHARPRGAPGKGP
jgi:AcrR family transcriptional regulator